MVATCPGIGCSQCLLKSVLAGPLDAIDQKDIDRASFGLQFEPKLFLKCGED